jgi:hypothetical protein
MAEPFDLFYLPFRPAIDANGIVVAGASLTFYLSGTSTLRPVYADAALTTPLANPLTANAAGVWPSIYIDNSITYRVVLKDADGAPMNEVDPYVPGIAGEVGAPGPTGPANSTYFNLATLKAAAQSTGSYTLVTGQGRAEYFFKPGDFTGEADDIGTIKLDAVPLTQGALVRAGFTVVDVTDVGFGAKGDFIQDDTAAIQRAIDYVWRRGGGDVRFPAGTYKISLSNPAGMFQLVGLVQRGGINLVGQSRTTSIIKLRDNDPSAGPGAAIRIIGTPTGSHNGLGCYNLGVDGNLQNQPNLAGSPGNGGNIVYGLFEGIPSNVVIDNCASYNAYGQGIMVTGFSHLVDGAYPNRCFNVRISNNDVYDCSFIGIQVSQFLWLQILNNKLARTRDNGIDVYGFNNNFSAPAVTSSRGIISGNQILQAGGAGIFPETVSDMLIQNNISDGCVNGIQANNIAGVMQGTFIHHNKSINCQNGFAHTGAHTTHWADNEASGFTYAGFCLGSVGGEASFATYERFRFAPPNNTVPMVVVPDGCNAANFDDPGFSHQITEADTNNPTPANLYFYSTTAALVNSPRPVFTSVSAPGPSGRLRSPIIEGQPLHTEDLPGPFASNAEALANIGRGKDYIREVDGPTYRTHS